MVPAMSENVSFDGQFDPPAGVMQTSSAFLLMVGSRVRSARARKGISRRVLSETSGVSPRYLAQLESGNGNVSIALLLKIATALDLKIEWLVAKDDPWTSKASTAQRLFDDATIEQRRQVMEILEISQAGNARSGRIALTGLRGAGKSTLGRLAAAELGLPFIELNAEIETASGMPINEVFSLYGQDGYRRLERQALEHIAATHENMILAVAGGIVSEPDTYTYFLRNYSTIWLKASPEEHMARVQAQGDERPMTGRADAMADLRRILVSREVLYAKAEGEVDTTGLNEQQSLQALMAVIKVQVSS
ncbi:MAG: XRE family aerobic/anaerobic benzoate catabolism transcriptional regulator [Paracoccaceae bacterium]|jgi:XRE family aerobic/anaerobic benzoate catabolism transcriptional regulator